MKCLKRIVWDWNGTLFDDVDLCFSCINRLLVHHGLEELHTLDQYRNVFGFPIENYYKKVGFDFEKTPFSVLADEYMKDYQEKSYHCLLHKDALETISKANQYGFTQTVLSASKKEYLLKQMKTLHVDSLFDSIYGITDIFAKSKMDLASRFVQTCNLDDEIWFVGDSLHDYEVAKQMQAHCVLVTTGHQSRNVLEKAGVAVVDSLMEGLDVMYERSTCKSK